MTYLSQSDLPYFAAALRLSVYGAFSKFDGMLVSEHFGGTPDLPRFQSFIVDEKQRIIRPISACMHWCQLPQHALESFTREVALYFATSLLPILIADPATGELREYYAPRL